MNIIFNKQKTEIREDPFIRLYNTTKEFVSKYANAIIATVVIIILITAATIIYNSVKKAEMHKAQDLYGQAFIAYSLGNISEAIESFNSVIDNHKKTPLAAYSAFMLGHIYFQRTEYDQAISWFEIAAQRKKDIGFVAAQTLESIGTCYEHKGDIQTAMDYYKKAIADSRLSYRHPAIRWKMALLAAQQKDSVMAVNLCKQLIADTSAAAIGYREKSRIFLASLTPAVNPILTQQPIR